MTKLMLTNPDFDSRGRLSSGDDDKPLDAAASCKEPKLVDLDSC
jgi:hypothetical protein